MNRKNLGEEALMNLFRRSGAQLVLLILAVLGVADAIYLTLVHYDSQVTLVCSNTGFINCERVVTSPYSYVPGTAIPISVPGLGWSLVVVALALLGLFLGGHHLWLRIAQFTWTLLGLLTALYLIYVEIVRLHNLCAWCTVLHVLILVMFLIALVRLPGHSNLGDKEWGDEEEAEVVSTPVEQRP